MVAQPAAFRAARPIIRAPMPVMIRPCPVDAATNRDRRRTVSGFIGAISPAAGGAETAAVAFAILAARFAATS